MSRLEMVTFDLDSTMYSYPGMMMLKLPKYIVHLRLIWDLTIVRARIRKLPCPVDDFKKLQASMIADIWNTDVDYAYRRIEEIVYNGWNADFSGVKPYHGLDDFIEMLVRNRIKIAVISDYPPERKMEQMGLMKYPWVEIVNCEDIGCLKPHPAGFEYVLKRHNIRPERALHIGDKPHLDIVGAKKAGMMTAWKARIGIPRPGIRPDYVFFTYPQLKKKLMRDFSLL